MARRNDFTSRYYIATNETNCLCFIFFCLTVICILGAWSSDWSSASRPRNEKHEFPTATLPPNLHHASSGTLCPRRSFGRHQFPGKFVFTHQV